MSDKKVFLTKEQAISLLPETDDIHTFRNGAGIMIGCDWRRAKLIELIESLPENSIEIGGSNCRRFGHGLVLWSDGMLFIECDDSALAKFDVPSN